MMSLHCKTCAYGRYSLYNLPVQYMSFIKIIRNSHYSPTSLAINSNQEKDKRVGTVKPFQSTSVLMFSSSSLINNYRYTNANCLYNICKVKHSKTKSNILSRWCGRSEMMSSAADDQDQPTDHHTSATELTPQCSAECFFFHDGCSHQTRQEIGADFTVVLNFVTPKEESALLKEVEPHLRRMRYEYSHFDGAIEGYKETEVGRWSSESSPVVERIKNTCSTKGKEKVLVHTHVLDLAEEGFIKPHVDSVRFCGSTIAGVSLNTQAVMRLVKQEQPDQTVDVLLPRCSLYIMRDSARYSYTHEVLSNSCSRLGDRAVRKTRRLSIICRNQP